MPSLALACRLSAVSMALRRAFPGAFDPASLFASGEQGLWYDVSDFSTLFQDAAGTTPVIAVEQPVGLILDKSKGLVLGPELVTNGDFNDGTASWESGSSSTTITVSSGELRAERTGGSFNIASVLSQSLSTSNNIWYAIDIEAYSQTISSLRVSLSASTAPGSVFADVPISAVKTKRTVYLLSTGLSRLNIHTTGMFNTGNIVFADNISVRELPGNHAYQPTTTARGVLRSRYNLLTHSEDFSQGVWTKSVVSLAHGSNPPPRSNAVTRITANGDSSGIYQTATVSKGLAKAVFRLRRVNADWIRVQVTDLGANVYRAWVNLAAGTIGQTAALGGAIDGYSDIELLGDGWYEVTVSAKLAAVTTAAASMVFASGDGVTSGAFGLAVDCAGIDLRPADLPASLPPYQRIAAATDYDTVGFPVYLDIDGTDDNYITGSIDFTGTDKMTIWAGLRKVDDTVRTLCELGVNSNSTQGAFIVTTGVNASFGRYSTMGTGSRLEPLSTYVGYFQSELYPAPDSAVITAQHDIAGDLSRIRRNGSSTGAIDGTGDKGTGNFGNYPVYLFSRGGNQYRWRGQFYGMIIRGAATDTSLLEQTERYLNGKMGGIY